MIARVGPVVMTVQGDEFTEPARIAAIIWEGATADGDTVALHHRGDPARLLWAGRTDRTNTYLGVNLQSSGIHAPNGFRLHQLSAGRLLVYLREE